MRRHLVSVAGLTALLLGGARLGLASASGPAVSDPTRPGTATEERLAQALPRIPLYFEANRGQADSHARFVARGPGYALALTGREAWLSLRRSSKGSAGVTLRMTLAGADPAARLSALEPLPGKVHYYLGKDSRRWRADVPTYARVRCEGLYPGIDAVYYGTQQQLEYDFLVAPGADPDQIRMRFTGAEQVRVDASGDLILRAGGGELRQHRPVIYQEVDGRRVPVDGSYRLLPGEAGHPEAGAAAQGAASGERPHPTAVGFRLGAYDRSRPLVIDPVLTYASYVGGASDDDGQGVGIDGEGNLYLSGTTSSIDFPTPLRQPEQHPSGDAYVLKLNPETSQLLYTTFIGGGRQDVGRKIAVDAQGQVSLTGNTWSDDFPTKTPVQAGKAGRRDAFVTRLNPDGSLRYSTYLGGSGDEDGNNIAVDAAGAAYVVGTTYSGDFPRVNALFSQAAPRFQHAFVTMLAPSGSSLVYSTYLGGSRWDEAYGVAVDGVGNAYVTGTTHSTDFPTGPQGLQLTDPDAPYSNREDAFLSVLAAGGSGLLYSTYLGGTGIDEGYAVAVSGRHAYLTGKTYSEDNERTATYEGFPVTANAYRTTKAGEFDAFLTRLDTTQTGTTSLLFSSYLGGGQRDIGNDLALGPSGDVFLAGSQGSEALVARLRADGRPAVFSLNFGGSREDVARAVAVGPGDVCIIAGETSSPLIPLVNPYQGQLGGRSDAFIARYVPAPPAPPAGLEATAPTADRVELRWQDLSFNESGFRIERATAGGAFSEIGTVGAGVSAFSDTNVAPETTFVYRVRAYGEEGVSAYSGEASVTTPRPITPPAAPSGLQAAVLSSSEVRLTWQDNSGSETGFKIERNEDGGSYALLTTTPANTTTYSDTTVRGGHTYQYRVRATSDAGDSADAGPVGARIDAPDGGGVISVSTTLLNFGTVSRRRSATRTLTIRNAAPDVLLEVTVPQVRAPFSVVAGRGTVRLGPGESQQVIIRFRPTRRGAAAGALTVRSSDRNLTIRLTGRGR